MEGNCLGQVVTAREASDMWNKDPSWFKKMCQRGLLNSEHYTKAGREWLILVAPLRQRYGEPVRSLEDIRREALAKNDKTQ